MRTLLKFTGLILSAALIFASCSGGGSTVPPTQTGTAPENNTTSTASNNAIPSPPYQLIEAPLTRPNLQSASRRTMQAVETVPVWSSSFSFGGANFPFTMVGTDALTTTATTVVPTEIQPMTFVFSGGKVIDGTAPANAVAASPIFHNAVFPTETGQYADVIQRAEFNRVGSGYHVLLGTPTVLPTITIQVPGKFGKIGLFNNRTIGLIDFNFLFNVIQQVLAVRNFDPTTLPVLIVGNIAGYIPPARSAGHCCVGGFHFAQLQGANGIITFAYAAYLLPGFFRGGVSDITAPSHEVAEWANDPLIGNVVPPWGFPTNPSVCVNNLLEVGDPIEVLNPSVFPVTLNGTTYHPQDEAFFSWFAHQVPSIAINGQYSYISPPKLTSPPPPCQ